MDSKELNGHHPLVARSMCSTTADAELDNGIGRCDVHRRVIAQSNELQSNTKGVLFLLLSARASLLRHGADDACLRTMEDCVASFRMQHDLTHENTNAGIVWKEASVGALLRLLEYVHREVSERLQDWHCAEQLETCIEHLKAECVL
jgi:environmental stress-induced protein Ves